MEYELAGFDNANGSLFTTNLRAKRHDKTTFGITGTAEILVDFSDDYEVMILNSVELS